jgi:hypothetical protein
MERSRGFREGVTWVGKIVYFSNLTGPAIDAKVPAEGHEPAD